MSKRISGVYQVLNLETGKRYIGSTNYFERRKRQHRSDLRLGKHGNPRLQKAYDEQGKSAFSFLLLEKVVDDYDTLIEKEQWWMDQLNPEYNIAPRAGYCVDDYVHNKDAHKKISKTIKKMWADGHYDHKRGAKINWKAGHPPNLGRKFSAETREKIRQANLGSNNPNYGKPRSEAFLQKMRKTYPGAISPDGEVYAPIVGLNDFCKEHGLDSGGMSKMLNGKSKSHKGWTRYKEQEE